MQISIYVYITTNILAQGQKQLSEGLTDAVQSLDLGETESDTDSISTPSSSPSHRNHPGNPLFK